MNPRSKFWVPAAIAVVLASGCSQQSIPGAKELEKRGVEPDVLLQQIGNEVPAYFALENPEFEIGSGTDPLYVRFRVELVAKEDLYHRDEIDEQIFLGSRNQPIPKLWDLLGEVNVFRLMDVEPETYKLAIEPVKASIYRMAQAKDSVSVAYGRAELLQNFGEVSVSDLHFDSVPDATFVPLSAIPPNGILADRLESDPRIDEWVEIRVRAIERMAEIAAQIEAEKERKQKAEEEEKARLAEQKRQEEAERQRAIEEEKARELAEKRKLEEAERRAKEASRLALLSFLRPGREYVGIYASSQFTEKIRYRPVKLELDGNLIEVRLERFSDPETFSLLRGRIEEDRNGRYYFVSSQVDGAWLKDGNELDRAIRSGNLASENLRFDLETGTATARTWGGYYKITEEIKRTNR